MNLSQEFTNMNYYSWKALFYVWNIFFYFFVKFSCQINNVFRVIIVVKSRNFILMIDCNSDENYLYMEITEKDMTIVLC